MTKECMNNEQLNVKRFRDDPNDTSSIVRHTNEAMEIEHTCFTINSRDRNKLRGNKE